MSKEKVSPHWRKPFAQEKSRTEIVVAYFRNMPGSERPPHIYWGELSKAISAGKVRAEGRCPTVYFAVEE